MVLCAEADQRLSGRLILFLDRRTEGLDDNFGETMPS